MAAFSVDLEDYYQVEALRPFCPRELWESFPDRIEASTSLVLDILDRHGVKGTFFVLGWTAKRHARLVRRIAAAGHEIASHGFDHELIYRQDADGFRDDIRDARKLLQDLSGQPVIGYRAPSYTIMARTLWALPILLEEGFRYDSSVYPIARRRYGMPGAKRWPHRIDLGLSGSIAEFPLSTIRVGPVNLPATGGAYLRLLPLAWQGWAVRRLIDDGKPVQLSIHPWELDPGQPRFPVPPRTRWTHYHNLDRSPARLSKLLALSGFGPVGRVLSYLRLLD
ncbi:MAG: XrtA system polysaccharide deacetylase [Candidatus Eisenbacteria bacterium]